VGHPRPRRLAVGERCSPSSRRHLLSEEPPARRVAAQFSLTEERLAFPIRDRYGEIDYPTLHAEPHPAIVHTLVSNVDVLEMYRHRLPNALD